MSDWSKKIVLYFCWGDYCFWWCVLFNDRCSVIKYTKNQFGEKKIITKLDSLFCLFFFCFTNFFFFFFFVLLFSHYCCFVLLHYVLFVLIKIFSKLLNESINRKKIARKVTIISENSSNITVTINKCIELVAFKKKTFLNKSKSRKIENCLFLLIFSFSNKHQTFYSNIFLSANISSTFIFLMLFFFFCSIRKSQKSFHFFFKTISHCFSSFFFFFFFYYFGF